MASICTNLPRSGGKYLDSEDGVLGCLEDSSYALDNPDELRGRLEVNGYLYLKQFFPWKDVLKVRKEILARMRNLDLILPRSDALEAMANPARPTALMPELAQNNQALENLIYGERVMEFYKSLLEGPVLHYDFTWFRPVGPGVERRRTVIWFTWDAELDVSLRCGCLMAMFLFNSEGSWCWSSPT